MFINLTKSIRALRDPAEVPISLSGDGADHTNRKSRGTARHKIPGHPPSWQNNILEPCMAQCHCFPGDRSPTLLPGSCGFSSLPLASLDQVACSALRVSFSSRNITCSIIYFRSGIVARVEVPRHFRTETLCAVFSLCTFEVPRYNVPSIFAKSNR